MCKLRHFPQKLDLYEYSAIFYLCTVKEYESIIPRIREVGGFLNFLAERGMK